jgi:hypothetical protein
MAIGFRSGLHIRRPDRWIFCAEASEPSVSDVSLLVFCGDMYRMCLYIELAVSPAT